MRNNERLLEAKRRLYAELLNLAPGEFTDAELDLGAGLARDEQVQTFLLAAKSTYALVVAGDRQL